ncbi:surface protein Sur1, partial [Tribonema minus]
MSSSGQWPAFEDCLPSDRPLKWALWSTEDRRWLHLASLHYEHTWRQRCSGDATAAIGQQPCIPHTLHQVWLGGSMPSKFRDLRESWAKLHDGWELRLWGGGDVEDFGLENRAAFDAATNYGEKSDIFRYEILHRHGGIYVDVDFLCLQSLQVMADNLDFFAGLANVGAVEINNGLIG